MFKSLTCTLILLLLSSHLIAQITISPEIGISYSPFEITQVTGIGEFNQTESNKSNLYIGLSIDLPVHENWYVGTRIGYNSMQSVVWSHWGFIFNENLEFKHFNVNMDFLLYRKLFSNFDIGIGASIVKKFNSRLIVENSRDLGMINNYNKDFSYYGVSLGASYSFKYFDINVDYMKTLNTDHVLIYADTYRNKSRLNATISVPIRTQRKESQYKKKKK